jgi:hypothetical protein
MPKSSGLLSPERTFRGPWPEDRGDAEQGEDGRSVDSNCPAEEEASCAGPNELAATRFGALHKEKAEGAKERREQKLNCAKGES